MLGITGKDNLGNKVLCFRIENPGKDVWSVDNWEKVEKAGISKGYVLTIFIQLQFALNGF